LKKYTLHNRDIILLSNQMFHDRYWTSKQYITMELIKNNRVLYIEGNYSIGKLVSGLFKRTWPVKPFGYMTQERENLFILTPFPRIPLRNHFRLFGWLNQKLLLFKIRRAGKKLKMKNPVFWTFLHQSADLVDKLDESLSIYHCVDDWPERFVMMNMGRRQVIKTDEETILGKTDLIISVSPGLLSDYKIEQSKFKIIENGVDLKMFKTQGSELQIPLDLNTIVKPIIGFAGSIGKWIDLDLYKYLLKNIPDYSFVMIGLNERKKEIALCEQHNNFYYLGLKSQHDVPKYINGFDVCLMPFNQTRIAKSLLPQKMFQYLAMGKPVVSSFIPTLEPFKDILYIAENPEQFGACIQKAVIKNQVLIQDRINFAEQYDWKNRMIKYESALSDIHN